MKSPKTVTVIGLDAIGRQYSAVSFLNVRENWDLSGMPRQPPKNWGTSKIVSYNGTPVIDVV